MIEADARELKLLAETSYQERLTQLKASGEIARAELDARMREGNVERFLLSLRTMEGAEIASLQGRQQFLQVYQDMWMESHRTMFSYVAQATQTVYQGLSSAITNVITGAMSAKEAFKALGVQMIQMVVQFMAQRLIAFALEKTLTAAGLAMSKGVATAALATSAALAGAHAAAATAASIATFGGATAFGALVPPMMAANAALGSSIALAAGGIGGAAHGGLDFVPKEQTFLLDRGERVVSPEQNRDLTEYLEGNGGNGIQHITLEIDGHKFADYIYQATRDGRMRIHSNAIV
jgi:hypothetical protein